MSAAEGLGEALQTLRERRGLSQRQVADRASTTQSMVSRYERGASKPEFWTVEKLLRGMGYSLADLDQALREIRGEPMPPARPANGDAPADLHAMAMDAARDEIAERRMEEKLARIMADFVREFWRPERDQDDAAH